ncbi:MAG: DNA recombination protein RmuC [Saccharospirillaceae bacterium]|nr:DNA recombination protein RmuC [Saccharospirillaceae bacterium]
MALTADKAKLENGQKERSEQINEYKTNTDDLHRKLDQSNNKMANLKADIREQKAILTSEEEKVSELKKQFEKQKINIKNEFKVVSEEIITDRQKSLNEQNKLGIGALIKPLKEQIISFQRRVDEVHIETVKGNTNLEAEIKKVMEVGIKMRNDASDLTSVLKGDSQIRGAWGEEQLERTLEMSGLIKDCHYEKKSSFKDQNGKQKQTDYLIKLPVNKHIIIDSKVSLIAYDRAISSKIAIEQTVAMNEHVKSIKRHIDNLASKDYTNLIGMNSPDFVLMFMSIEPAYIEALKYSKELFGYGYDKNIVLVSHTTLIPILRTVSNLWMLDQSNNEARKISEKAGDIYNSVCTVSERFQTLGNTLNTASTQYNNVVKAISGRQGLQGKVERFTQFSNKVSKKMPEIKSQYFDYEISQLNIQPIETKQKNKSIKITNGKSDQ